MTKGPSLITLALTAALAQACSASRPHPETRKVSSLGDRFPAPLGTTTLFECGNERGTTARVIVNDSLADAHDAVLNDGTSKVLKSLRKAGQSRIQLDVLSADGRDHLYYNAPIQADLHNGAHHFFAEDIEWPRGLWEGKSSQLLFHPDGTHEFEGTHPIDENVELRLKSGDTLKCYLPSELRVDCC